MHYEHFYHVPTVSANSICVTTQIGSNCK